MILYDYGHIQSGFILIQWGYGTDFLTALDHPEVTWILKANQLTLCDLAMLSRIVSPMALDLCRLE